MATTTTRINGTAERLNYGFYALVTTDDTIVNNSYFNVNIKTYIVNGGTRTDSGGWHEVVRIDNVDSQTLNNQRIKTNETWMPKNGGEALIQDVTFQVSITLSSVYVYSQLDKDSYTQYDPGLCILGGWVSMPKVQSMWSSNLLTLSDVTATFTLPITKYVQSYYNVVTIRNSSGATIVKTINDANNGTQVTFTSSELNTIYAMDNNANQNPLVFYLDLKTYTDSSKTTQVGNTQTLTASASVVNSNPTIDSYTLVETNQAVIDLLDDNPYSLSIPYVSQILFTINVTAKNGASIQKVIVRQSSSGIETQATLQSGVYKATISPRYPDYYIIEVTDSRGLTGSVNETNVLRPTLYVLPKIHSGWTIERVSPVSSDLKLNAVIDAYDEAFDSQHSNSVAVQYSTDNSTWVTIPSTDYTYSGAYDYKITITDLVLSNLIPYNQEGKFYLRIIDLLTSDQDQQDISTGVYTFAYGKNKMKINGDLLVADANGDNPVNVLTKINERYLRPTILFQNWSAQTGDIQLTISPSTFDIIEIFYIVESKHYSQRFFNNKTTPYFMIQGNFINPNMTYVYFYWTLYQLNGNWLRRQYSLAQYFNTDGTGGNFGTGATAGIYLILGYKL